MGFILKFKKKSNKTEQYLINSLTILDDDKLKTIAEEALLKFKSASPTEEIKEHWDYEIYRNRKVIKLYFTNSLIQNGVNIAVLVDNGHMNQNGYWVNGKNYLPKATKDAYETILQETWEAMKKYEHYRKTSS